MNNAPSQHQGTPPDLRIEKLFFKDIEKSPSVIGRNDYLPLTRRIQRWMLLKELSAETSELTLENLKRNLRRKHHQFNEKAVDLNKPELSIIQLSTQIEVFLDNPDVRIPEALKTSVGNRSPRKDKKLAALETLGWRCFYLLSLLPPEQRATYDSISFDIEISNYFDCIHHEGATSKTKLLEGCMRYVINISRLYIDCGLPYLDLVQEGFTGLDRAADGFDEQQGAHFQMYAGIWIRQRLERYIADFSRLIRIPIHRQEETKEIDTHLKQLRQQLGREPKPYELSLKMNWISEQDFHWLNLQDKIVDQKKRLKEFRQRVSETTSTARRVPLRLRKTFKKLQKLSPNQWESYPLTENELKVYKKLGWISDEIYQVLQSSLDNKTQENISAALNNLKKAEQKMQFYEMFHAVHYSIERDIARKTEQINGNFDKHHLIADTNVEDVASQTFLREDILEYLYQLSDREREIIIRRFGLLDGAEETLEEIGDDFGLTRERIRQIEYRAIKKLYTKIDYLKNELMLDTHHGNLTPITESHRQIMERLSRDDLKAKVSARRYDSERRRAIEQLIEKHVEGGRKRVWNTRAQRGRAEILKEALEEIGEPVHYSEIHEKAHEMIAETMRFSKKKTYATLFYHDYFTLLGGAVFGLSSWDTATRDTSGNVVFKHCPQPLLPEDASVSAFFESIMRGRQWLNTHPDSSAREFWLHMRQWAGYDSDTNLNIQAAFDAWYATGLIGYVDTDRHFLSPLSLEMSMDLTLSEARRYCIDMLCKRIQKMSELLLTIDRVADSTLSSLKMILFGGEQEGFDVYYRTILLQSVSAISKSGNVWKLTPIGKTALERNPPDELPDFDIIEEQDDSDEPVELEWDEEIGFIEF